VKITVCQNLAAGSEWSETGINYLMFSKSRHNKSKWNWFNNYQTARWKKRVPTEVCA